MKQLYQRKPEQAEQYTGDNNPFDRLDKATQGTYIQTSTGVITNVLIGDWIVREGAFRYIVVKPDVFIDTYGVYVQPFIEPEPIQTPTTAIEIDDDYDEYNDNE